MRIDDRNLGGAGLQQLTGAQPTPRTGGGSRYADARYSAGLDNIEISDTAALVQTVTSRGAEERAQRVEQLASLYQAGRYEVPVAKISHALVNLTLANRAEPES